MFIFSVFIYFSFIFYLFNIFNLVRCSKYVNKFQIATYFFNVIYSYEKGVKRSKQPI